MIVTRSGSEESFAHGFQADADPAGVTARFALTRSTDDPPAEAWQDGTITDSEQVGDTWVVGCRTPTYLFGAAGDYAPGWYVLHRLLDGTERPREVIDTVVVL